MTKQTYILAFLIFILSTGGYTAMPLFPLLTDIHSITFTQASTLTAVYIFIQQASPVLLGPLGDIYGYKRMAVLGELMRGIGFIGAGCVSSYSLLLLFSFFAGLGGGFAGPSLQSLMMKSTKHSERTKVSSLRTSAVNAALLLGPILAGIVIWTGYFNFIFISAGTLYLLGSILLLLTIDLPNSMPTIKKISPYHFTEMFHNRGFIHLMIFMLIFYILFAQLFVTLPEYAKQFTDQIQSLFLVNGITGLVLQYPFGVFISKSNKPKLFMVVGIAFILLSFLTLSFWNHFAVLFIAILLFTVGQTLILPIMETEVAAYSDKSGNTGLYFGVSKLSDGIGRPLGSMFGGWIFYTIPTSFVWFSFALICIVMLLYYLKTINFTQ